MNQTQRTKKVLRSKHALGEFYPAGRRRGELKKITFVKWHRRIYGRFPCNMHKTETYPDKFKVKLEKRDSDELGKLYDFLFDELHCSGKRWIVSELGYRHHCRHCGDGRVYY